MKKVALGAIRLVAGFFRLMNLRACRFYPTCSAYAEEAFGRFSFFKALYLTAGRVLRCHPFSAGGYDPLESN